MKFPSNIKFNINRNSSKDFRLFLLSYIIILIIPLVTTAFGYLYSYKTIQQDAYLYHSTLLYQGKTFYDGVFNQISSDVRLISSTSLTTSLGKKTNWDAEDLFQVVKLRDELANIKKNNNYIDYAGVYFHKNKSFISNETRYAEVLAYLHLAKLHISLEDFLGYTTQPEGYFIIDNDAGSTILYYRNTYLNNHRNKIATAYIIISCSKIAEEFKFFAPDDSSGFFMLNHKDQVLWNTNENIPLDLINNDFLSGYNNLKSIYINKIKYCIGSIASDVLDGQYVIYTPYQILFQNINYLKYIIIAETILSTILGILLACYFTRKNYGPIERMLTLISSQKISNTDIEMSRSYNNLEHTLRNLLQDNYNLKLKLRSSNERNMEAMVAGFMKGLYVHEEKVREYLNHEPTTSGIENYRIILFSFKNLENHALFNNNDKFSDTYDLLIFSVRNVTNELLYGEPQNGFNLEIDNMIACIVPVKDQRDMAFQQNVHKCMCFLKDAFGLETYASVSALHSQWSELPTAYDEAFMAKAHKTFWGNEVNDIVYYMDESMHENNRQHSYVFSELQKKLSNLIITKKYDEAFEVLNDIIENCFSKDVRYIRYNQYQASSLISTIMNNISALEWGEANKDYNIDIQFTYLERLSTKKSLLALKNEIYKILNEIIEIQHQKQAGKPEWLEKVKEYIIKNYHNPDINITHIADKFSMSVSYMGGTFRKYEGMSILDYIHTLRIEECKKLLLKDMTLQDCSDAVGYTDVKTFIRAFKRYEGITPGQYRTNAKMSAINNIIENMPV